MHGAMQGELSSMLAKQRLKVSDDDPPARAASRKVSAIGVSRAIDRLDDSVHVARVAGVHRGALELRPLGARGARVGCVRVASDLAHSR